MLTTPATDESRLCRLIRSRVLLLPLVALTLWLLLAADLTPLVLIVSLALVVLSALAGSYVLWLCDESRNHLRRLLVEGEARKQQLRELLVQNQEARREAEAANEAKTSFLLNIGHEVRTPLNGLLVAGNLLSDTSLSPVQHKHLETMRQAGEHLLSLFERVMDLSRLESQELRLNLGSFSLRSLLGETLEGLASQADVKGVRLTCAVADEIPEQLVGDAQRLGQTLHHLVHNAVKFTHQGEVAVRVSREDRCRLRISIRDTGIGIAAEQLADIFQPFRQADSSSTRLHGGCGIGLSIATRLAQLMGGTIEVESAPGLGSTFRLSLPLIQANRPTSALVLDADEQRRSVRLAQVERGGLCAVGLGDPRQALAELLRAVIEGSPYSVLVVHDNPPHIDADELTQQIKTHLPVACPVLVYSERAALSVAGNAATRVSWVLPTDVGGDDLGAALRELLAVGV